ncbi:restriction endonuclease [Deinococcus koreensis]|uniref:Restriction endonuclease n=1 Tax=Deinococcus koreensis TaxID=2054903 RepID=A0A2K3V0E9_9DEIO|nr:restriction endonuclease [Deinococcus koreensis]PNY82260.1 restriction endonuclease [Deinococcus koreensis]
MAVPEFQTFFRPVLEILQDGRESRWRDLREPVAVLLNLTPADREELVPSGGEPRYINRINWAITYLSKAGALESTKRGYGKITDRGRQLLTTAGSRITSDDLDQFPEFLAFRAPYRKKQARPANPNPPSSNSDQGESPEEQLATLYTQLNDSLAAELLQQVQDLTPTQFERLVVQVLVAMGYGGTVRDAGQALGRSGDNGVDGLIKQDPLGLDRIYLQAKRWQNTVHSPEIRTFSGSLTYHKASKGVFITTSTFSDGALRTAAQIGNIILLDGGTLTRLMIDYGVGVTTRETYRLHRMDSEYFEGL